MRPKIRSKEKHKLCHCNIRLIIKIQMQIFLLTSLVKEIQDDIPAANVIIILYLCQRWRFLMLLLTEPPSDSPADCSWPPCSHSLAELSLLLRRLHHKWRVCHFYDLSFITKVEHLLSFTSVSGLC